MFAHACIFNGAKGLGFEKVYLVDSLNQALASGRCLRAVWVTICTPPPAPSTPAQSCARPVHITHACTFACTRREKSNCKECAEKLAASDAERAHARMAYAVAFVAAKAAKLPPPPLPPILLS